MENKYYTPDILDLHVGYECEWKDCDEYTFEKKDEYPWESITIDKLDLENLVEDLEEGRIRTSYLTKEQLEAEGWTHTGGQLSSDSRQNYEKNGVEIEYWELNQNLVIKRKNLYRDASGRYDGYIQYFKGKCPSINEFRTICKLLNIK